MNSERDENLIQYIATTVETMHDEMGTMHDEMGTMRGEMATMGGEMATMRGEMATKGDIVRLEAKLDAQVSAVRGDLERIDLRLDSIDRTLKTRMDHMETEISRLRSVLYLLVKDRPEILKLLGTERVS